MRTKTGIPILKGPGFTAKLARVAREPLAVEPLADLKYRNLLMPGLVGGEIRFARGAFIAQALRMRGAEVTSLACDAFVPACTMRKVDHYESACTRWCHKNVGPFAEAMKVPYRWYSEFITRAEMKECDRTAARYPVGELDQLTYHGVELGGHVRRSVESYFKVGQFDPADPAYEPMVRGFIRAGMYLVIVIERALDELGIDKVVVEDGKKVDWGVPRSVAVAKGIPVDVIHSGLGSYSMRLERDRPPRVGMQMPEWEEWREIPLTEEQERELDAYMLRREQVPYEYRSAEWQMHTADVEEARRLAGLPRDVAGCVFGLFPNVSYDAGKTSTQVVFESPGQWIIESIRWFERRPEHHLVVKVHPSETLWKALDPLMPQLERAFPRLPANVHIIPPTSDITAHAAIRLVDWVLAYTSTVSAEAAALGKPVMIVGGGWNSGRGWSHDCTTAEEYFERLDGICRGTWDPPHPLELARRYAYALFFRSNIRINWYTILDLNVRSINIDSLADLAPGKDAGMDAICEAILRDGPCEEPATRVEQMAGSV